MKDRKYSLNSNIIDVVIFALATETSCDIKLHYQDHDKSFDTHVIKSQNRSHGSAKFIELAFVSGHYDLVVKNALKQEQVASDPVNIVRFPKFTLIDRN